MLCVPAFHRRPSDYITPEATTMTQEERQLICLTLDVAHYALRCVDASDPGQPQSAATLHTVSNAIAGMRKHGSRSQI